VCIHVRLKMYTHQTNGGITIHIQTRGDRVELVRTTYDTTKKRGVGKIIGSFKNWERSVPSDLFEKLDQEEQNKINDWLDKKNEESRVFRLKMSLEAQSLNSLSQAVEENEISTEKAKELFLLMDSLKKSLRKAGFTRKNVLEDKKPL